MGRRRSNKKAIPQAGRVSHEKTGPADTHLLHLLLIVVFGLLIYSNTFHVPFQWDEATYLLGNPLVKDLGFYSHPSRAAGLMDEALKARYVGYLTFALNYRWGGFDVLGYHIVNLAIHLANALLVYFLVLFTFRTPYFVRTGNRQEARGNDPGAKSIAQRPLGHAAKGERQISEERLRNSSHPMPYALDPMRYSHFFALIVALLFVAHPVQTEAVTYIFQRFASLVALFYLLSLVFYIRGRLGAMGTRQWTGENEQDNVVRPLASRFSPIAYYFFSLLCAVLAMKTKENAFTLPVVITLYEFLFFRGPIKSRLLRLVPFLLTMLIVPSMFVSFKSSPGDAIGSLQGVEAVGMKGLPRFVYFITQFRVIVTYLRLLFLPVNQNLVYAYPSYASFFAPPVLASFAFLAFLFGTALWLVFKSRQAGKPTGLHAGKDEEGDGSPLASGLLPLACVRLVAFGILWFFITLSVESSVIPIPKLIDEYRLYLPSVGFFVAAAAGAFLLLQKFTRFHGRVVAAVVLTVVVPLAAAAYVRNSLWQDRIAFWQDVVRKSPSSPTAHNNLGIAYREKGMYDKALESYQRSIDLSPSFEPAYVNMGVAYAMTGRTGLAIGSFTRAIALTPADGLAYANLARAYADTGDLEKAAKNYAKVVEIDPYNSAAFHGLGTAYVLLGRVDEALAAYSRFAELSPRNAEAFRSRGMVYAKMGDRPHAAEDFRRACSLGSRESCRYLENYR